jgi:hypothetical protein
MKVREKLLTVNTWEWVAWADMALLPCGETLIIEEE